MKKGYGKSLKGYTFKEFKKVLEGYGFIEHHRNSAHVIFVGSDHRMLTVPFGKTKINSEMNHMMTTIILQRIKNNHCRQFNIKNK